MLRAGSAVLPAWGLGWPNINIMVVISIVVVVVDDEVVHFISSRCDTSCFIAAQLEMAALSSNNWLNCRLPGQARTDKQICKCVVVLWANTAV